MKFAKIETSREEINPITGGYCTADYIFWCEGCHCWHGVWTTHKNENEAIWEFNHNLEKPTVNPSIKITWKGARSNGEEVVHICHSFVREGMIQYLDDCTHELKGKTVELRNIDKV